MTLTWKSVVVCVIGLAWGCVSSTASYLYYKPKPHFSGKLELVQNPVGALESALQSSTYEYGVHGEILGDSTVEADLGGVARPELIRAAPARLVHEDGTTQLIFEHQRVTLTYNQIATFVLSQGIQEGEYQVALSDGSGDLIIALGYLDLAQAHLLIDALAILNPSFDQHTDVPTPQ